MTGPFPGQGDGDSYPDLGYTGLSGPPPRRRKPAWLIAAIVAAVVVLAGAGTAVWYFVAGPGRSSSSASAQQPTSNPPTVTTTPPTSRSSANPPAAYDVGSCFAEQAGSGPGKVELNPETCGGDRSVFVINKVVAKASDCDAGQNYHQHGYEVPDETANVAYCASLVVPVNACFVLGGTAPIERTTCGGGAANVVQVLAVESAANADAACTDKPNPDVWFYQSPDSGQFACVSRPVTSSSTAPTS